MEALIEILEPLISNSVFAVLFIYLFLQMRKENASREEKYHEIIATQGIQLEEVSDTLSTISATLTELREEIKNGN
jgi:hypothetical protein